MLSQAATALSAKRSLAPNAANVCFEPKLAVGGWVANVCFAHSLTELGLQLWF